ncbi:DNA cytosine methyltransferase [Terrimonas sp. NA20]|uniref:DNA (cytosine-5-)-methyltransferase n=1 Tax=Terrimonas ginsenosidimutans TaxID=2908004 RepID=A0ABS9KRD7_9BACT|nr:DNA cytosine methyltransferase [Terrimonas ginsenosidimutans]MCG2614876.1 DNA cytosine methyltransferase [Terrimonas ginsenosidimutans]
MYNPKAKGYFSGCGGFELGIQEAGVELVQSLDLDAEATACMKDNPQYFNHKVLTQDITQTTVLDQPGSDVILGTYPCTKYSPIADISETRTGDELYLHFFRHMAIEQPEVFALENVPGMRKFKVVMEAMTRLPGYYVTTFCPVRASYWLPQRRDRLIVIGSKKPFDIPPPIEQYRKPRIKDIIERDPEVSVPDYIGSRLNGKYRDKPIIVDPEKPGAIAPTCVAHYAKDQSTRLVRDRSSKHGLRPFTIREYARLQGFPDDFKFKNELSSFRLIGNAVPPPMGRWVGEQIMRYFN